MTTMIRNKSLILISPEDDENQIIQVEIICVLSIFFLTHEILKNINIMYKNKKKTDLRLFHLKRSVSSQDNGDNSVACHTQR